MPEKPSTDTVELIERIYEVERRLPRATQMRMKWNVWIEPTTEAMVIQLRARVWARPLGTQRVVYPRDWWEAFKHRFFPLWALARWPVRHAIVTIEAFHEYPGLLVEGITPRLTFQYRRHDAGRE